MKQLWKISLTAFVLLALLFSVGFSKRGEYAWLGVSTQTVDKELAEAFELSVDYGTIINEIIHGSPADIAGLKEGDIIITFDKDKVYDYDDLIDNLENYKPNDKVTLTIMRDDDRMDIDVTLGGTSKSKSNYRFFGSAPSVPAVPSVPSVPRAPSAPRIFQNGNLYNFNYGTDSYIGVQLADLSDQLREYFGADDDKGVLVSEVEKDTPAEKAGIKAGDIIIKADDEDVYSYKDLKYVIEDKDEGDKVRITVLREKREQELEVTVAQRDDNDVYYFQGPDVNIRIPKGNGYHYFSDDWNGAFNQEDLEEIMEELQEELKEIEKMKVDFNRGYRDGYLNKNEAKQLRRELEKAKKEIKDAKNIDEKKLQKEIEELKKELIRLEKKLDD